MALTGAVVPVRGGRLSTGFRLRAGAIGRCVLASCNGDPGISFVLGRIEPLRKTSQWKHEQPCKSLRAFHGCQPSAVSTETGRRLLWFLDCHSRRHPAVCRSLINPLPNERLATNDAFHHALPIRIIAAALFSTSLSVVAQLDTEILMAV